MNAGIGFCAPKSVAKAICGLVAGLAAAGRGARVATGAGVQIESGTQAGRCRAGLGAGDRIDFLKAPRAFAEGAVFSWRQLRKRTAGGGRSLTNPGSIWANIVRAQRRYCQCSSKHSGPFCSCLAGSEPLPHGRGSVTHERRPRPRAKRKRPVTAALFFLAAAWRRRSGAIGGSDWRVSIVPASAHGEATVAGARRLFQDPRGPVRCGRLREDFRIVKLSGLHQRIERGFFPRDRGMQVDKLQTLLLENIVHLFLLVRC